MNGTHLKQIEKEIICQDQMPPTILQLYCTYIFRKLNMTIKKENFSQLRRPQRTVVLLLHPSLCPNS